MIPDKQLELSNNQSMAGKAAASSTLSTNTIDLGAPGNLYLTGAAAAYDVGRGEPVQLLVQVTTAFTSAGAATVQVQLVMADAADLTTGLTVIQETPVIAIASLVAGYQFRIAVPPGISKRYLGCAYNVGTATVTAGTIYAAVVVDKQTTFVG